jgi:hypothetical protein
MVAPEVGTPDGPDMTYSAIRADRWACGRMIDYLERCLQVGKDSRIQGTLRERLMSDDPKSRPSLKGVLDAHRNNNERVG